MRKINKIITTLFLVAVFGTVALNPITASADEQQSVSLTYTEEQAGDTNAYEISIPSSLDLNNESEIEISMTEISALDDSYAVHVELDRSVFNGTTSYNTYLYPEDGSNSNYLAYRIRRTSDNVDLHMGGGTYEYTDVTAAIFYGDSNKNVGGTLQLNADSGESRPADNGTTYTGNLVFNIYGGYE